MIDSEFYDNVSEILRDTFEYEAKVLNMILVKNKARISCIFDADFNIRDEHEYNKRVKKVYKELAKFFNKNKYLYMGFKKFENGPALIYNSLLINPNLDVMKEYDSELIGLILGYSCHFPILYGKKGEISTEYEIYDSDVDEQLFAESCENIKEVNKSIDIKVGRLNSFKEIFDRLNFRVRLVIRDKNRDILKIYT